MRRFCLYLLPLCLFAAATSRTQAAPNGLTQIPIAKVFGDGVASFSAARAELSSKTTVYTSQYGLWNWLELGVDYQAAPSEQRTFLSNAKVLLAHNPGHIPDISFGVENLATGQKASPYMVATTAPGLIGVSAGAIRPGGSAYYGLTGVSYNLNPNVQVVADEIMGRGNYATLGVIANITPLLTINVAYARGNARAEGVPDNGYVVNLAYTFHLKSSKGSKNANTSANKNPTAGGSGQGSK